MPRTKTVTTTGTDEEKTQKEKNIFREFDKRTRRWYWTFNKNWPDGRRCRKRFDTKLEARVFMDRFMVAYRVGASGDNGWKALRKELEEGPPAPFVRHTIASISKVFVDEHAINFKTNYSILALDPVIRHVGDKDFETFGLADAKVFANLRLKDGVEPSTVNKGLIAISGLFSYAATFIPQYKGLANPLSTEGRKPSETAFLPVDEAANLREPLQPHEVRQLIEATLMHDQIIGTYVAILAACGLRKQEGLQIERRLVDLRQKQLNLSKVKGFKPRKSAIPISDYACELISALPVIDSEDGREYLLVRPETGKRLTWPDDVWNEVKAEMGILWPTFHDLRRYAATWWLGFMRIKEVSILLGHHSVTVTEKYTKFSKSHASAACRAAAEAEQAAVDAYNLAKLEAEVNA